MKTKKLSRLLVFFLALLMVFSGVGLSSFAEEPTNNDHTDQVRVIIENTTYTTEDGAPWDGTLVDEWVTINPDKATTTDTMMSCVVTALENHDYTQEGADNF